MSHPPSQQTGSSLNGANQHGATMTNITPSLPAGTPPNGNGVGKPANVRRQASTLPMNPTVPPSTQPSAMVSGSSNPAVMGHSTSQQPSASNGTNQGAALNHPSNMAQQPSSTGSAAVVPSNAHIMLISGMMPTSSGSHSSNGMPSFYPNPPNQNLLQTQPASNPATSVASSQPQPGSATSTTTPANQPPTATYNAMLPTTSRPTPVASATA